MKVKELLGVIDDCSMVELTDASDECRWSVGGTCQDVKLMIDTIDKSLSFAKVDRVIVSNNAIVIYVK